MSSPDGPTRSSAPPDLLRVHFGIFELDEANACLLRDGKAVPLPPTPFAVLCALARRPGALLTKNALLDAVWGHQFVSESVLKTVIQKLRTVLGDDARQPRFIETVSRRGYRLIAPVTPIAPAPAAGSSIPNAGSPPAPTFIGREDALARLHRAWDLACAGRRTVVWVAGDPGIGKTTLIEHFVSGLGEVACARGQCVDQYGSGEPYLPVLEALAALCRRDSTLAPLLRGVAPSWLLQLPWLSTAEEREAIRRELAGVTPERMLREMGELLDRYSETRPLLLVTEDLQWSDRATLQLMDHVARRRSSGRLMWLASYRLAEVIALDHPLKALRHELRLHGLCEEIVLDTFSEKEVGDYVAERAPWMAADEPFVRGLHERTDGLPLFVSDVMTGIIADAARAGGAADAAARLESLAVPEHLVGIIDHFTARLASEQRVLLEAAAVCGAEFRVSTVADVLGREAAWVEETCDGLAREQMWLNAPCGEEGRGSDRSYSFRHALVREVLYERASPPVRARLHRRAGIALERERAAGVPVTAAQLAMHFVRGRDPMTALRYYAEAAEAALQRLSPVEAMTLTERGLSLLDHEPKGTGSDTVQCMELTLATLHGVAAAHSLGVSSSEAKTAFERACALLPHVPQHPLRALLLHGFGFALCLRAEYAEALVLAERAEALWSTTNDPVLLLGACTVQGEVQFLKGRPRIAREWIERALALDGASDAALDGTFVADPYVVMLGLLAIQLLHLGFVEEARRCLLQAHTRARRLHQPMARMVAIWFDALFEVRLGNAGRVAALAEEMEAIVDEFALAEGRAACRWFRGWAQARMGEPQEGYRRIRDGYETNVHVGMLAGASETLGYAAEALLLAGDWNGAQAQLEEALQIVHDRGERVYLPQLLLIQAAISDARGQSAEARVWIRRAVAEARAQEAPWLELIALLALCERADATTEDRQALAAIVDSLPEALEATALARARALLDKAQPA